MNPGLVNRLKPALILLALACWMTPLGTANAAGAQIRQAVRVAASPTGGRIVFLWDRQVQANAAAVGNRVVLIFNHPLRASLGGIARGLPAVVRRVDVSGDRQALTIVLHRPHAMRLIRRGHNVIVVLHRPSAKLAARRAKPLAKPKPAAKASTKKKPMAVAVVKGKPKAIPTVAVTYHARPAMERMTFTWDRPVNYSVERVGGILWLKFARAGRINLGAMRRALRGSGVSAQASAGKKTLEVFVRAARVRAFRHRKSGKSVILEIRRKSAAWPALEKRPIAKVPAAKSATKKVTEKTSKAKKAPAKKALVKTAPAKKPEIKKAEAAKLPLKKPAGGSTAGEGDGSENPPAKALAQVSLTKPGGVSTLRFDWSRDVPAAVFRRGRYFWLVFGATAALDLAPIAADLKGEVESLKEVSAPNLTIVRFAAGPKTNISVGRDGSAWLIALSKEPGKVHQAIGIEAQSGVAGGGRVLLKAPGGVGPIVIKDPSVGDILHVVLVRKLGFGVASGRRYVKFRLLPTLQGVVVEPVADGVVVRAGPAAVTVSGTGGLGLSRPPGAAKSAKNKKLSTGRVFDFDRWRGGPARDFPKEYTKQRQLHQHAVALADKAERNARRLDLARFYFTHGHASDALGVLRSVEKADAELARTAKFRALRGAGRFLMAQLKSAGRDLYDASLDDSFEVALWRGALAARSGKWKLANRDFRRSRQIVRHYPANLRARLGALAAEAAVKVGELSRARNLLAMLRENKLQPRQLEALEFLDAALLAKDGQNKKAVAIWTRLAEKADDPHIRARSKVARIEYELAKGKLKAPAAIEELEKARYVWRGDVTEYRINELLGRVYLRAGNVPKALEALDRARRLNPDLAKARKIKPLIQRHYMRLFLAGGADKMPPLRALGVFHEFSHLIPSGPLGDRMIAALADRLVAVDLLDRAAALLSDQIDKRLTGVERARVGARLALLQLLDKKPAAAIKALRTTDIQNMPPKLARQRRRLRARALASIGQTGNALVLLGPDRGREAELLRADIHWKAGAWKEAAAVYGRIARSIPANAVALDDAQSRIVLAWAVTLALAGDGPGLKALRARFGRAMTSGPYRATFQVIANEVEAGVPNFQKIAAKVSEVDAYHAFMRVYRKRIAAGGLQAVN